MLHILLLILKIIGIILLALLGIIIALLLIVLLVPIRYHIKAEKEEEIGVILKAGWLMRILYFRAEYKEETFIYAIKLFGFTIRSNIPKKKKKLKYKKSKSKKSKYETSHTNISKQQITKIEGEPEYTPPKTVTVKEEYKLDISKVKKENKRSLFIRFVEKCKQIWCKFIQFKNNIFSKIKLVFRNIWNTKHKLELVKCFLQDEQNRLGLQMIYHSLKKTLKHSLPKRIKGRIQFGTGDPCSTGQALGAVSLLYAYYGNSVTVIPDFHNEIMLGYIMIKGRIRIGTLLIIAIKLFINENFKHLVGNYRKLKEEL